MTDATTRHYDETVPAVVNETSYGQAKPEDAELEKKDIVHVDQSSPANEDEPEMAAGLGVIEQRRAIPLSGKRKPTTRREYWSFIFFNMYSTANPLGGAVQNIRQMLLVDAHPSGFMEFAGTSQPINTVLLDINGILAVAGLVLMFIIGPYADYGNWRPWILIVTITIAWAICFGMLAIKDIEQWPVANVLWAIGSLTGGVVGIFYQATYPGLARDLPKVIQSEEDVLNGLKTPEEHDKLDSMERAQIFNYASIFSSVAGLAMYGAAYGLAKALQGDGSPAANLRAYHWLIVFYTPLSMIFALPYLLCMQWRPGSAVPAGITMWTSGPRQVVYAAKSILQLKQTLLYLVAYIFLWEAIGAFIGVYAILLLENVHYSPSQSTAFTLVGDVAGGLGTVAIQLLHKKFAFKIKWIMFFGSMTSNFPNLWGAVGTFTNKIGFHHSWEFWFFQAWNMVTACASTYNVTMISEVVPASKLFMFYSLFKTIVGGTGFSGPFIVAAIIKQSHGNSNTAFWFLFAIGTLSTVLIYFVDTDKAKIDCAKWAEREAEERYTEEQRMENKLNVEVDGDESRGPA